MPIVSIQMQEPGLMWEKREGYASWAKAGVGCNWVMGPGCSRNLLLQPLASGMISKGVFGKVE